MMGNALVVGIIERLGKEIESIRFSAANLLKKYEGFEDIYDKLGM